MILFRYVDFFLFLCSFNASVLPFFASVNFPNGKQSDHFFATHCKHSGTSSAAAARHGTRRLRSDEVHFLLPPPVPAKGKAIRAKNELNINK